MKDLSQQVDLTVFLPVYNEVESLPDVFERLNKVLRSLNLSYEILFVDDGSNDGSFAFLKRLAAKDHHVKIVRLAGNFGQTAAMRAGIERASGQILVAMDADLQNDPVDIPLLLHHLAEGWGVVSGWRRIRQDPWFSRQLPSKVANWLISKITGLPLHDYGCTLKAYRREVLDPAMLFGEMHRFLPALAAWRGARVHEVEVSHQPRRRGRSKYGLGRAFKVLIDLITVKFLIDYSAKPNYVFGALGIGSLILGGLAFAITSYRVLVLQRLAATPMVFMMVVFLLGGVQLILMGLLAEIIIRQQRTGGQSTPYVVAETINLDELV